MRKIPCPNPLFGENFVLGLMKTKFLSAKTASAHNRPVPHKYTQVCFPLVSGADPEARFWEPGLWLNHSEKTSAANARTEVHANVSMQPKAFTVMLENLSVATLRCLPRKQFMYAGVRPPNGTRTRSLRTGKRKFFHLLFRSVRWLCEALLGCIQC